MSKSELLVGLDIGTTKICVVVGEVNDEGKINIVGVGSSPSTGLRKGVVVNIDQTVQSIRQAISEAEAMVGCQINAVYVGIAGSHIHGTNSNGAIPIKNGEVSQRDMERVIESAKAIAMPMDREIIHILPQDYSVDNQKGIIAPLGMSGVRLEVNVHIVTGSVTSAQNILRSCTKSGIETTDIVLESLASSKAVITDEELEIGIAIVDIGGGTSDIAIFTNNAIKYTGAVPYGGQNVTSDISYGLRTPMSAAEQIKIKYGCALREYAGPNETIEVPSVGGRPPRQVARQVLGAICEPRMEEILFRIDEKLELSGYKRKIPAGIVLTGGGALLEGTEELAEQIFGLPTRIGTPQNLNAGFVDMVNNPKFATAVGLLFYGAEKLNTKNTPYYDSNDEDGMFQSILGNMKKWFSEIK